MLPDGVVVLERRFARFGALAYVESGPLPRLGPTVLRKAVGALEAVQRQAQQRFPPGYFEAAALSLRDELAAGVLGRAAGGGRDPAYADVLGLPIHIPVQDEAVLLGAAILGAAAGGAHPSIEAAMGAMSEIGSTVAPEEATRSYHEKKYKVFCRMSEDQRAYRSIMEG